MNKINMISRIREVYLKNGNIIKYLKEIDGRKENSIEDIMISYDFQAGSYIDEYKKQTYNKKKFCSYLSSLINRLGEFNSLIEAGVGEATTLRPVLEMLENKPDMCLGFDISWSRIKYARCFLEELDFDDIQLFTGDLFCIPIKDNSIDIVYTCHSIEPNGGKEKEALEELYRITNKYLILLEPSYEFANEEARVRMLEHGYITKLYSTANELGYNIIEHRLFEFSMNPMNPTGLIIIKKDFNSDIIKNPLCCPITRTDIIREKDAYFSKEALVAYPILNEIPCLLPQNAILATKFI